MALNHSKISSHIVRIPVIKKSEVSVGENLEKGTPTLLVKKQLLQHYGKWFEFPQKIQNYHVIQQISLLDIYLKEMKLLFWRGICNSMFIAA